jgi:acyl-CoA reductase-like NAD-dependent aldehyde dehydrogenase
MFEGQVHDPQVFIAALREYREAPQEARGELANAISEAIIRKRVDLAEVRLALVDGGEHELLDELNRLIDLIEPYIEEGGVDE